VKTGKHNLKLTNFFYYKKNLSSNKKN